MLTGLTPPEPFRWFPANGARHAVLRSLVEPGDSGETLCGDEVVVPDSPPPKFPDGLWPTCDLCDEAWHEDQARRAGVAYSGIPGRAPRPSELHSGADRCRGSRAQLQAAGVC